MGGSGVEVRLGILKRDAEQKIIKLLVTHGWATQIIDENESGEYLVIQATKANAAKKMALLYTTAVDNRHYKILDDAVDAIFSNGGLYMIESFAHGIKQTVTPVDEFYPKLVQWNKELAPTAAPTSVKPRPTKVRRITAENPLIGVWSRLDQFASVNLAERLVKRRAADEQVKFDEAKVASKSLGVAFTIRSASDYFKSMKHESLNKRIISLYYGCLALACAEMLASPRGPADLDEIEEYTKYGHGFYTLSHSTGNFGELGVGVLATGFFPHWAAFLGADVSGFPKAKAKAEADVEKLPPQTFCTVADLLSAIPEITYLFAEVFERKPSWVTPISDTAASGFRFGSVNNTDSTYIKFVDRSGLLTEEDILSRGWPIAELSRIEVPDDPLDGPLDGQQFRARVDHPGCAYWFEVLPMHDSTFQQSATLLISPFKGLAEYRTVAMAILYAFSIMVRYMPSTWRRVEGGDLDQHLALVKSALAVFERNLPEEFLEAITAERIVASQPGGLFG